MRNTFLTLISFLICSCVPKESSLPTSNVRDLDFQEIAYSNTPQHLSEFVESISYIQLSEEPLIPDLENVSLVIDDEAIYIDIREQVLKYTVDGDFIQPLFKLGPGPEEVSFKLGKAIFNLEKEFVAIRSYSSDQYKLFSLKGSFLGTSQLYFGENKRTKKIVGYDGDNELYCWYYTLPEYGTEFNIDGPAFFYVRNMSTNQTILQLLNYHDDIKAIYKGKIAVNVDWPVMYGKQDSLHWIKPVNVDTIYRTTDLKSITPWYVIHKKSSAADYKFNIRAAVGDISKSEISSPREDIGYVLPLQSGILFSYWGKETQEPCYGYCPANGKANQYSDMPFKNDIDGYLNEVSFQHLRNCYVKNGNLYMLVDAFRFFEEGSSSPFKTLTPDSNPVIIQLKLKE